jgi:hypothetical protein
MEEEQRNRGAEEQRNATKTRRAHVILDETIRTLSEVRGWMDGSEDGWRIGVDATPRNELT